MGSDGETARARRLAVAASAPAWVTESLSAICAMRRPTDTSPTGKSGPSSDFGFSFVQSLLQKYFCFAETKSRLYSPCPVPLEGRFAIVTNAGRDAVDADGASDEGTRCGRRSRVVLTPRRWCQVRGRQLSRMTVAKEPVHRGERAISRKPLRGECRVIPV
jgi:hypothetical protein